MIQKALKVLLIENESHDLALLRRDLSKIPASRIEFEPVSGLARALERLRRQAADIDAILLHLAGSDSQGLDAFRRVHRQAPHIPIVVLSGFDDEQLAVQAVRQGAQDYLVKGHDLLRRSLQCSVERMRIAAALRRAREALEVRVRERTAELAAAQAARKQMISKVDAAGDRIREALLGIVQVISLIIESRDPYTAGHQRGVAELAQAIARKMGLPEERIEGLKLAALVHDLGKISTPADILAKPTTLTEVEMNMIRVHPRSGYEILKKVAFPWPIAQVVLQHHERINGSGYPQKLRGPEILLEAKILGVADVVEAMCSHRPYRPALGLKEALTEIRGNRGVLYDPQAVDACLAHFNDTAPKAAGQEKRSYQTAISPHSSLSLP